ncbi:galactokinase [Salinimicrobium catena]|uniref:Galactokinase n=1 Tax=Salinimicrobium catena TaxID=390640 RepID=A0A1H5LCK2_9FLAO|nr:galactokinase [Salinimicrobium catena]SDL08447.1 galactokinase [Salinimicrobium catena]SEE74714.1 galactokinase [Salinimicrobium catena]
MSTKHSEQDKYLPPSFQDFTAEFTVQSPGRINLIGEHTDYNNGYVLPTAINKNILLQFAKNSSEHHCNIYSKTYEKNFSFDLRKISRSEQQWENYILGVISEIQKQEKELTGFDCIIDSDLPVGAGISSSAALECGMAFGLNELFDLGLDRQTMAELSQRAEHNYVGTKCGIMDQYASMLSKKDHLLLLDCQILKAAYVPAHFQGFKILLLNTRVTHSLADSEYNTRRKECEEAVLAIQKKHPQAASLRDVSFDILEDVKEELSDVQYKRALYVLQENERVLQAVKSIKTGDLSNFGDLMYDSHVGLRDDYEVSCKELDFLVDFSKEFDGVYGARMMGGGFGGCTINLIKEEAVEEFVSKASAAYFEAFGIQPEAIIVAPEEGTKLIRS